jgi:hypothetical protein
VKNPGNFFAELKRRNVYRVGAMIGSEKFRTERRLAGKALTIGAIPGSMEP